MCYTFTMKQQSPYLIIANWKMNPLSAADAVKKIMNLKAELKKTTQEVVVCPPFVYLDAIKKTLPKYAVLGAQDVYPEKEGSYTGEISPKMLKNAGVSYTIIGHSERRRMGEDNEVVRLKMHALLAEKITPVVCVGELSRDEAGLYLGEIKKQIETIFEGVTKTELTKIVIAYEPVWGIGAGATRSATPEECLETVIYIKKILSDISGDPKPKIKIIYGASVDEKNAQELLIKGGVEGLLVGRLSLDGKKFGKMIGHLENK